MVKPGRNKSSSSSSSYYFAKIPDFFKVYLPDSSSQQMRIPPSVAKHIKGDISFNTLIRNRFNNKIWRVSVKKVGDYFAFEQGWAAFVKDNSLEYGYFLIFSYNGSSEFHVTVYGEDQCHKEYLVTPRSDEPLPCKSEEIMSQDHLTRSSPSEKPFFEIVLRASHIQTGCTNIPMEFVKKYIREERASVYVKCAKHSWEMKIRRNSRGFLLSCGWLKFVMDNNLKQGDLCRFELIPSHSYTFNVSILTGKRKVTRKVHSEIKMPNYPHFKIVLNSAYMGKGFLHIPSAFWRQHLDKQPIGRVMLEYSSKLWPVKLKTGGSGRRISFGSGLSTFFKENNLQVGNVCYFELIEKENHMFMFRVSVCTKE